jgi:NADH-quinone oxidoreductase subunit C
MSTSPSTFQLDIPQDLLTGTTVFRDEVTLHTGKDKIRALLAFLKNEQKFEMLTDETCVDYYPSEPRFGILYQLYSLTRNIRVRVKVMLSEYDVTIPSACSVYVNANWLEREVYDLFGIIFEAHPDLRRILMPSDWQGHPLRREIPVQVEENAFTFNRERIDAEKPRATE